MVFTFQFLNQILIPWTGCDNNCRIGADAWSLMYPSIPEKLRGLYNSGYKLVCLSLAPCSCVHYFNSINLNIIINLEILRKILNLINRVEAVYSFKYFISEVYLLVSSALFSVTRSSLPMNLILNGGRINANKLLIPK